jgi:hypothetical protein
MGNSLRRSWQWMVGGDFEMVPEELRHADSRTLPQPMTSPGAELGTASHWLETEYDDKINLFPADEAASPRGKLNAVFDLNDGPEHRAKSTVSSGLTYTSTLSDPVKLDD